MEEDLKYINVAFQQAKRAYLKDEVPVGAVIVKDSKIISKAYNQKETKKQAIYHAEILAICKANQKINNWRLNGCTIYTTLHPCPMCMAAIKEARIDRIVYATVRKKDIKTHMPTIEQIVCENVQTKTQVILKEFFKNKRK